MERPQHRELPNTGAWLQIKPTPTATQRLEVLGCAHTAFLPPCNYTTNLSVESSWLGNTYDSLKMCFN